MALFKKILISLPALFLAFGAYAADPVKAEHFLGEGDAAFNRGLYQQALTSYQKASRYVEDLQGLKVKIARTFYQLRDYATATQVVNEVLEQDSTQVAALLIKGRILEATNNNQQALEFYNRAAHYAPHDEQVSVNRANALRKLGREQDASAITRKLDKQRIDQKTSRSAKQQKTSADEGAVQ